MLNNIKLNFDRLPIIIKFVVVGGFNTIMSFVIYSVFVILGLHFTIASLIGLISGIAMGYLLNKNLVFDASENTLARYVLLWAILYFLNISIIYLVVNCTAYEEIFAGLVALVLIVPVSYLLQKHLIFRA